MKSIKPLMFLALVATFTSCTEMRYANRTRARVNQEAKAPVKKEVKETATEVAQVPATEVETTVANELPANVTVATVPTETTVPVTTPATAPKAKIGGEKNGLTAPSFNFFQKKADPIKDQVKIIRKDVQKKIKEQTNDVVDGRSQGLRLIIIGLIILLIGILLPGAVGAVFYIVGGILMVIGLIILLLELV